MRTAIGIPTENADGGVRIGNVVETVVKRLHGSEGFVVGGAMTPDFALHEFETIAAQIQKAWKIIGASYIHGIRTGGGGLARVKFSGAQILRHDVVGIGGSNEARDRQAYAFGENSRG